MDLLDASRERTETQQETAADEIEVKRQFAQIALADFQRRRKEAAAPKQITVIDAVAPPAVE